MCREESDVNSEDGEEDTHQKDRGALVHVLHPNEHHGGHKHEQNGAVHTHVVEHGCRLGDVPEQEQPWRHVGLQRECREVMKVALREKCDITISRSVLRYAEPH